MIDHGDPFASVLREFAREAAPQVLARIVEEGRAEAKAALQRQFVQYLLEEMCRLRAGPNAPRPAEPSQPEPEYERGWYVYGIIAGVDAHEVSGLPGVEGTTTEGVVAGDLIAVVSHVAGRRNAWGIDDDGEPDLGLLAPRVHEHERVLEGLLSLGTVLPMRFGTLYRTRSDIRDVLTRHRAAITSALSGVEGRVEWGLTVTWDVERARAALVLDEGPEAGFTAPDGATEGRTYLSRRARDRALAERLDEARRRISAEVHASLEEVAAAGVVHGIGGHPSGRADADPNTETLFKASYLVAIADNDRFRLIIVDRLEADAAVGLRGDLTGPWPPYNFAALELDGARS